MPTRKKILFIAPEFFNFPQLIEEELRRQGHQVFFVPDRPSKRALIKILIRKARFALEFYIRRHYERIFAEVPADVDEVFIIKGEAFSAAVIRAMRARFSKARFQLYLWDSLNNSSTSRPWFGLMDRVWSFDFEDSRRDPCLRHLPNFVTKLADAATRARWRARPIKWNLTFFGTVHTDRLKLLSEIADRLPADCKSFRFLYFPSSLHYYFRKFFDPYFKKFRADELSYKAKLNSDWDEIASSTVAILDLHHSGQSGLTLRALEALGSGLKLVTTNAVIREYDFYDPRLIRIIDRENLTIEPEFLRERSELDPPASLKNLELPAWCARIFAD